ncbi:flagellar assembly protein FliH [Cupriavidus basilensis]|uniref:flagellar assembly protein FliH n=1 Tax=Cupriavidus basilensis TaxID=68895 RepID=UPI0020A6B522|nr:flagellar assembly protein FliH [Cupriavidus basilensis]MCP3018892.1 flagellar assembly protein FliH [Cupriavidus basilensis]MDR3384561.1 flagellar assembly protein FliH [Cupriavidus basilensis]
MPTSERALRQFRGLASDSDFVDGRSELRGDHASDAGDGRAAGNRGAPRQAGFESFAAPAGRAPQKNGWQRWQMVSLDPRKAAPAPAEFMPLEPAPPPIDFAALDAMREGARKEGYAQGYTQGQTQGYGDGHREGYARGLEGARTEAAHLQQLAATFSHALGRVDEEVAQTLISLALDVARQLVQQAVQADPAVLLPAVRELLAAEPALSGSPCLLLNPEDVTLVETHLTGELQAAGWSVRADPAIARGGCVASAASGELDATLSTRWSRVVKALGRDDPWEPPHA